MRRSDVAPDQLLRGGQVICGRNATRIHLNGAMKQAAGFTNTHPQGSGEKIICLKNRHDLGLVNGMFVSLADVRNEGPLDFSATVTTEDGVAIGGRQRFYKGHYDDHVTPDPDRFRRDWKQVRSLLDAIELPYVIDPTLVRGLDYYARTVFEFSSEALGAQSGVGGGGRYDGLAEQIDGPPTPGFGWAAGVERILLAAEGLPEPEPLTVLFVARADDAAATTATSFALSAAARRAGVPTQIELAGRSIKGQFKHADRVRARYVAAVSSSGIELKDFESGETTQFEDGDAALAAVLRGRGIS